MSTSLLDPLPSDDQDSPAVRPSAATRVRPPRWGGHRVPPAAWPAIVAALGVVVAGLLLAVVVSSPSPVDPVGSPVAGAGSFSPSSPASPASTPVPSQTAPTPSVTPTAAPTAPAAWPPRPALPAGWAYELACDDDATHCLLHLRDAASVERPGWPVRISGTCWQQEQPVGGPDGTAYVACDAGGRSSRVIVHAVRLDGTVPPGWPVRLKGELRGIGVAQNGTVYVGAATSAVLIHALGPDAGARAGWPRKLPEIAGGFTVAPDGAVVAWWYEGVAKDTIDLQARRTKYTTIAPNGRTRRGWPITSIGTASEPVVGRDGTVYYVSATGKVYGHDRRGAIVEGWPFRLRAVTWTGAGPAAPWLRDDGRLMFVAQQWDKSGQHPFAQATVLTTAGRPARGWPYRVGGSIEEPACCTDCFPMPLFDVSVDGTLFFAPWDGEQATAVALDAGGRMLPGWPRRLHPGWRPWSLAARPDGGVDIWVADTTGDDGGCGDGQPQTVTIAADGSIARDVGVSTFAEVYGALRPQRLRTATGTTTLAAGRPIELAWDLVNTSRSPLVLPHAYNPLGGDEGGDEWAYLAGVEQMWLERLGPDPTIACVSPDWRRGTWYPWGGTTVAFAEPVTIAAGGALERSVTDFSADCLVPGRYRFHLELHEIGYDVEFENEEGSGPIAATTLDIQIAGPPATPSPRPTSRPSPSPSPSPSPAP